MSDPFKYELEICWFGMKGDHLAERHEEIDYVDVELHLRDHETGEVHVLMEQENLPLKESTGLFDLLEVLFPDASHNICPE